MVKTIFGNGNVHQNLNPHTIIYLQPRGTPVHVPSQYTPTRLLLHPARPALSPRHGHPSTCLDPTPRTISVSFNSALCTKTYGQASDS